MAESVAHHSAMPKRFDVVATLRQQLRDAQAIVDRMDKAIRVLERLVSKIPGRRRMSTAGRKRIAAAQRKRWAKYKALK